MLKRQLILIRIKSVKKHIQKPPALQVTELHRKCFIARSEFKYLF